MSKHDGDDHVLMGPPINETTRLAVHYDGEGNASPTVAVKGGGAETEGWIELERCHASGRDDMYHIRKKGRGKGPANWNSSAYCEGWERIFNKKADSSTLN